MKVLCWGLAVSGAGVPRGYSSLDAGLDDGVYWRVKGDGSEPLRCLLTGLAPGGCSLFRVGVPIPGNGCPFQGGDGESPQDLGVLGIFFPDLGQPFLQVLEVHAGAGLVCGFQHGEGGVVELTFLVQDLLDPASLALAGSGGGLDCPVALGFTRHSHSLSQVLE